jgi:hypothetical protein
MQAETKHRTGFTSSDQRSTIERLYYDPHYVVPAGKRLVIDTLSAQSIQMNKASAISLWLNEGPDAAACSVSAPGLPAFDTAIVIMPLTYQGANFFSDYSFGGLAHVQSFADSGHCLAVRIDLNQAVNSFVNFLVIISGHLVSYP